MMAPITAMPWAPTTAQAAARSAVSMPPSANHGTRPASSAAAAGAIAGP